MLKIVSIFLFLSVSSLGYSMECDDNFTGEYQLKEIPQIYGHQEFVKCNHFDLTTDKGKRSLYLVLSANAAEYVQSDYSSYIIDHLGAQCWKSHVNDKVPHTCILGDDVF